MGVAVAASRVMFIRKRPSGATAYCALDPSPPELMFATGGELRPEERHRRAGVQLSVGSNCDRHGHQAAVEPDIEQFLPVGPPSRLGPARRGHLPRAAGPRKRLDVNLHWLGFVRLIRHPPPVGGELPRRLVEGGVYYRDRLAVAGHRRGPDVQPCLRMANIVEEPLTITRPVQRQSWVPPTPAAVDRRQRQLAAFSNRFKDRCADDPNTTRVPSGDHRGPPSRPGWNVKRRDSSRPVSIRYTSVFPRTVRITATRLPSGANSAPLSPVSSGRPTVPRGTPARSTQVS